LGGGLLVRFVAPEIAPEIAQSDFVLDYLLYYRQISPPTASRDLAGAVAEGHLERQGDRRTTRHRFTGRGGGHDVK